MKKIIGYLAFIIFWYCAPNIIAQTNISYQLSTHILDVNQGKPAADVTISLYRFNDNTNQYEFVTSSNTDNNGRISSFLPDTTNNNGIYKLRFETKSYFQKQNINSIYPYIEVVFNIDGNGHYHIPLTLAANGYSTYRGS